MITDLSVVEDPTRTVWRTPVPGPVPTSPTLSRTASTTVVATAAPAWSFGRIMQSLAGGNDVSDFCMNWLTSWEQPQLINGFNVAARPQIRNRIIDPWLQKSGNTGRLDMRHAPFRLLAIVNRIDLRANTLYGSGNAGEGRFVFGALDANGNQLAFTVIFEFKLPARDFGEVKDWARRWHALGSIPFGPDYNAALQAITDDFSGPNHVRLGQLRTNEVALAGPWELREFIIGRSGQLQPTTVKNNPDASFNQSTEMADMINQNAAAIIAGRFAVPANLNGGASPVNMTWNAPNISNLDARHAFAVNTCNGCHGSESGTGFTHVKTRNLGSEARLSGFLTGTTVSDPVSGAPRPFSDLSRRARDLSDVLQKNWFQMAIEPVERTATH
ncbi:MAG: hypothetical protein ACYS22_14540 [Planctomycetota bacterium]|jgi:hypothetical protein